MDCNFLLMIFYLNITIVVCIYILAKRGSNLVRKINNIEYILNDIMGNVLFHTKL